MSIEALRDAVRAGWPENDCRVHPRILAADQVEAALAEYDELKEEAGLGREHELLQRRQIESLESDVERLEAIIGPLNRLRELGSVEVFRDPNATGQLNVVHVSGSITGWWHRRYSAPTLAEALAKACKALLGEEANGG